MAGLHSPTSPQSPSSDKHSDIVRFAQTFSTCVECFGLIHPAKDGERTQLLACAKLGIQQARLLAWGDNMGVTETDAGRDARLDDPNLRPQIDAALQSIIDRPARVHRVTQFEKYGLKPPKRFTTAYHQALDNTRMEVFREKFEVLNNERWEVRRGMSVTAHHWLVSDVERFENFIALVKESVDFLINTMGNHSFVDRAVISDIKALGWHPIFERSRAAADSSKLRFIKETCAQEYPNYAAATESALARIDREWKENHQDMIERGRGGKGSAGQDSLGWSDDDSENGSEIPGAAEKMIKASEQAKAKANSNNNTDEEDGQSQPRRRSSIFDVFKRKSKKPSSTSSRKNSVSDSTPRSKSTSDGTTQSSMLTPQESPNEPARSKSVGQIGMTSLPVGAATGDGENQSDNKKDERKDSGDGTMATLSHVETFKDDGSAGTAGTVGPVTSMISRHDQYRADLH